MNVVFWGSPAFAVATLQALLASSHSVVGVVTQPDRPAGRKLQLQPSPVKELVQALGIPVFTPESVNTPEMLAQLQGLRAEVAVVVAFGQILKQNFLDLYPLKVVNVHGSILPRWRGAAPIQRALIAGDAESGVSLQLVVRKLDAGPVLGVRRIPLGTEINAIDLYEQCKVLGAKLIEVDLMDYLRGNLMAVPQDDSLVTHAAKIDKAESAINWSSPAADVHNLVRGLAMGPVAQTRRAGKLVKIHRTRVNSGSTGASLRPGQVVRVAEKSLLVQCGKGSLELLEVQPESRAKMPIGEYLRGYPVNAGDTFGPTS